MITKEIIKKLGLMSWQVILVGLKKGWLTRKDVVDYAIELLMSGKESENILLLGSSESLSDDDFYRLINSEIVLNHDIESLEESLNKWRLANLISISQSNLVDEEKLDLLQKVYADFGYPEDMKYCSIYSSGSENPLCVMNYVIENLKNNIVLSSHLDNLSS